MSVKLGIAPIAWSNDDMPELGGETSLEQCLSEASQAGFIGIESGGKFPKTSEELLKYYQDWADDNKYNKDMVDWNYIAPYEAVTILKKYAFNKSFRILDAGCGTGLVGFELKKNGYSMPKLKRGNGGFTCRKNFISHYGR